MKAVVAAFNQEKAIVGAFSVVTNLRMELFQALTVMSPCCRGGQAGGTLAGEIVTFNNFVFHCLREVVVN